MKESWIELVYDSLQGNLITPLPGVDNAFAPGSRCEKLYEDVMEAYGRLRERLGAGEDDADVEIIINSMLDLQRILCAEMYKYGARFGNGQENGKES